MQEIEESEKNQTSKTTGFLHKTDESLETPPDLFSRRSLEITFELLRPDHPSLSLAIQNILVMNKPPLPSASDQSQEIGKHEKCYPIQLNAQIIGKIVAAITRIGEKLLAGRLLSKKLLPKTSLAHMDKSEYLPIIKQLIQDWINLAEWVISQAAEEADNNDC